MQTFEVRIIKLSDYISPRSERNTNLQYKEDRIEGVTSQGVFAPTKANTNDINLKPYKVVRYGDFAYNPSRLNIGSFAYYTNRDFCIVSHLYQIFYIKEDKKDELLPEYLYMYCRRKEFYRTVDYLNYGSQRAEFNYKQFAELEIPLPPIIVQHAIVDAWKSLCTLKEQNEALAIPLLQLCQSYIQECKHKYDYTPIGQYLEESDERNTELKINLSQGVANSKIFQDPKQVAANSKADKIVRQGYFAFNRATTRNGEKISIAYREGPDCTVSSAYGVFRIKDTNVLNPYFLWMWFRRPEFDRYARYKSKGSAHEFFDFEEMCRVEIPLPPIDVQNAVVALYQCALEYKDIALKADLQARSICSSLMQHAINNNL